MPTLAVEKFSKGLDLRRLPSVTDADRFVEARNVYIGKGGQVRRKPAVQVEVAGNGITSLRGLTWAHGGLRGYSARARAIPGIVVNALPGDNLVEVSGERWITRIDPATEAAFVGRFVSAVHRLANRDLVYHYFEQSQDTFVRVPGAPAGTYPRGVSAVVLESRVFSQGANGYVYFCALSNPLLWRQGNDSDAGFLACAGAGGAEGEITALAMYDDMLAVFFERQIQIWAVDTEPNNMLIKHVIDGVGCPVGHHRTMAEVGGSPMWLGEEGYRMLGPDGATGRVVVKEVGAPIDALVQARPAQAKRAYPQAIYSSLFDQYLCFWSEYHADVFNYSRDDKIAAWTTYSFPSRVTHVLSANRAVYLMLPDRGATGALGKMDYSTRDAPVVDAGGVDQSYDLETAAQWDAVFVRPAGVAVGALPDHWTAVPAAAGGATFGVPDPGYERRDGAAQVAYRGGPLAGFNLQPFLSWDLGGQFGRPARTRTVRADFEFEPSLIPAGWSVWEIDACIIEEGGALYGFPWSEAFVGLTVDDVIVDSIPLVRVDNAGGPVGSLMGRRGGEDFYSVYAGGWVRVAFAVPSGTRTVGLRAQGYGPAGRWFRGTVNLRRLRIHSGNEAERDSVLVRTAYLDAKMPGRAKQWRGVRLLQEGACELSLVHRVDGRDGVEEVGTPPIGIRGAGMAQPMVPVEAIAHEVALQMEVRGAGRWTLGGYALDFEGLDEWV